MTVGIAVANADSSAPAPTTTPIKHVVVIYDENNSFDHYFGTYPNATNPAGEPRFEARAGTPSVNGLNDALLTSNPNSANPQRLNRTQAITCDQSHSYGSEQKAFDGGLMDKFVEFTQGKSSSLLCPPGIVMDYYDGNTVTGLWNLAQHFAMSDNSFSTGFGPSTPGALNLVSGNTSGLSSPGADPAAPTSTVTSDPDPSATLDDCAKASATAVMTGRNIGDLLGDQATRDPILLGRNLTWGWFQGGFRPSVTARDAPNGKAVCGNGRVNVANFPLADYSAHHNAFAYYPSTANAHHLPPSSADMIGKTDQANHQYDLVDFDTVLANHKLPAVSFLKAGNAEDGHPGSSDPLDEQHFIARTVNALERSPEWSSTAIIIAYDDSDGWYDHVMSPILNPSASPSDALNGPGLCGTVKDPTAPQGRCGYGPRQPLLVISPFAKQNFVDHTLTDQTSILRFIEDNWSLGRIGGGSMDAKAGSLGNMFDFDPNSKPAPKVFLDPDSGIALLHDHDTGTVSGLATGQDGGRGSQGGGQGGHGLDQQGGGDEQRDDIQADQAAPSVPEGSTGPGKRARIALACSTKGQGRKVRVSCRVSGADAHNGSTALRFRLVHGTSVLATARTTVKDGKATAVMSTRHAQHGRFRLRIAIAHSNGSVASAEQVIRLG